MKVVVLDDEKRVCALVCALVNWESLSLELVGTSNDGEDGLSLIKRVNPDIVITDIRMPSLDGLELIEKANEFNPDLQFIIISGYRQFDYAKKAIRFGVSDYLLKPLNKNELNDALSKMIIKCNYKKKINKDSLSRQSLRDYYLRDYIEKDYNIESFSTFFELSDIIRVASINVDGDFFNYDENAKEVIRTKLKNSIKSYLSIATDWEIIYIPDYHCFVLIFSYNESIETEVILNIKKSFKDTVLNFSNLYQDLQLSISIGNPVYDVSLLSYSLNEIRDKSLMRIDSNITIIESVSYSYSVNLNIFSSVSKSLINLTISDNMDFNELDKQISTLNRLNKSEFFLTVESIVTELYSFYKEQLQEDISKISFNQIYFLNTKSKILELIKAQINIGFELIVEKRRCENSKPIKTAQKYLLDNYSDNQLSLESLSDMVHLTPTYFSALFKKETNLCFTEYLRTIRINKATELLVSTSSSIKDVAKSVGYQDSRYFTKCFKKQIGIKPQDYRKLYG